MNRGNWLTENISRFFIFCIRLTWVAFYPKSVASHQYADDTQAYVRDPVLASAITLVDKIMHAAAAWMSSNRLRLNSGKTQFIWLRYLRLIFLPFDGLFLTSESQPLSNAWTLFLIKKSSRFLTMLTMYVVPVAVISVRSDLNDDHSKGLLHRLRIYARTHAFISNRTEFWGRLSILI